MLCGICFTAFLPKPTPEEETILVTKCGESRVTIHFSLKNMQEGAKLPGTHKTSIKVEGSLGVVAS